MALLTDGMGGASGAGESSGGGKNQIAQGFYEWLGCAIAVEATQGGAWEASLQDLGGTHCAF